MENEEKKEDIMESVTEGNKEEIKENIQENIQDNVQDNIQNKQVKYEYKRKFSFKRFFFGFIVLIATLASIATLMYKYVSIDYTAKYEKRTRKYEERYEQKGKDIVLDDNIKVDKEIFGDVDEDDIDTKKADTLFRYFKLGMILLFLVVIVFAVLDIIVVLIGRKRWQYVIMCLFSILRVLMTGTMIYFFEVMLSDGLKEMYKNIIDMVSGKNVISEINISSNLEIGFIALMAAQLIIFVSYIVLSTCKDKVAVEQI